MELILTTPDDLKEIVHAVIDDYFKNNSPKKDTESSINDRLITTAQLCEYLSVTPQTIIRYKKKKKIPFIELGTSIRFNLTAVLKALGK